MHRKYLSHLNEVTVDYNKLKTFLMVAKEGSITRASANLYLTQQAVSKQILAIEEELSLKLFNRAHNSIVLTRDGQDLVDNLTMPFEKINEFVLRQQGDLKSTHGILKIGISVQATRKKILDGITSFKKSYPNIKFEIIFDVDSSIEQKLLNNELDFGIIFLYRDKRILVGTPVDQSQAVVCCTKSFAKEYGPFKNSKDILGKPFVDYSQNFRTFRAWIKKNGYKGLKPFFDQRAEFIVENEETILYMISNGHAMGVIKRNTFDDVKKELGLIELYPNSKKLTIGIDIVHKKKESHRFAENKFKDFLIQAMN